MKQWIGVTVAIFIVVLGISAFQKEDKSEGRRILSLWDWQFKLDGDSHWSSVQLPHDWSIEGSFSQEHGSDWQSGFLPVGVGYYQRELEIKEADLRNGRVLLEFEGVYQKSTLYVNGQRVGFRPNGYVSFWYDITDFLKAGQNELKVEVDHSAPKSDRWYSGSGIYRPVHIHFLSKTHVSLWSPFIYTNKIDDNSATVVAQYEINSSEKKITGLLEVMNTEGELVITAESQVDENHKLNFEYQISQPELWSADNPNLYQARLTLKKGADILDVNESSFGVRTISVSPDSGLFVNDVPTKVKGVCMHHGAGPLGAAVPVPVLYRRLKLLKEMGCNAIRTSHNPFAPAFYNMCDSMGFMVMNEAFDGWEIEKAKDDYGLFFEDWWEKDLEDFIVRDRNHPSVVFWSIGNEVHKPTAATQKMLIDKIKSLDHTRPITQGGLDPTRGMKESGSSFQLDIKGFNGDGEEINAFEEYHERNPSHPIIGTEVPHTYQTRGVYRTKTHWRRRDFPAPWEIASGSAGTMRGLVGKVYPIEDLSSEEVFPEERQTQYFKNGEYLPIDIQNEWQPYLYYQSSYDNATVRSSARKAWQRAEDLPFVMGQFRWTAFDYLGETNQWPSRFANFGIIDICGFPKDHYYLYQSLWSDEPMVHMLPHWTHPGKEGVEIPVVAYTNCDSVELFLNDRSLGMQINDGEQLVWNVPYQAGNIAAHAYQEGVLIRSAEQSTAGKPHHIGYSVVQSQDLKGDMIYQIELSVQDENNTEVPDADEVLSFSLENAKWMGADNGDPLDLTDPTSTIRKTFRGKAFCVFSARPEETPVLHVRSKNMETLTLKEPDPL